MGFLDSFERSLERAVGGAFAKTFKSGVHPLEIVAALKREMDAQVVIVSPTRMLAPADYFVSLSEADYERLAALGDELTNELHGALGAHLEAQGYLATSSLRISMRIEKNLTEGMVTAHAVVSKDPVVWIPMLEFDGQRYPLVTRLTVIGRGSEADVRVTARGVSRRHCEIYWDGKRAEVVDLGSTNGTELNGVAITREGLPDRGVLGVGQARILVAVVPQKHKDYQALVASARGSLPEESP